jgi:hypothetical protein
MSPVWGKENAETGIFSYGFGKNYVETSGRICFLWNPAQLSVLFSSRRRKQAVSRVFVKKLLNPAFSQKSS